MSASPETKTCQNCSASFEISPDAASFYEKIKVSHPTFCPQCRFQRRFAWRNERNLYKRECALCGKGVIAIYSADKPFTVYCEECFHGDKWDPMSYGTDVDFAKPFLEQYRELQHKVPRQYAFIFQNVNSDYANGAAFNKNCYLIFVSDKNEDSAYSYAINSCTSTFDCLNADECDLCYDSVTCKKCSRVSFSQDCTNSQNLAFCKNCVNCQDCVGSTNLKNKRYHIFNQPYSKEEYTKKLAEMDLNSRAGLSKVREQAMKLWDTSLSKYIHGFQNHNVTGDYAFNSKNAQSVYNSEDLEDSSFMHYGNNVKNTYDGYVVIDNTQFSNEVVSAIALNNVKAGYCVWRSYDVEYSDTCENASNLFGCIGLKKKEYCILNKQYSKEEYETLVPKIIEHMNAMPYVDKAGKVYKYGEFFPIELSPFAYNETVAQEQFPLTKEEAAARGYAWKDAETKAYKADIAAADLPDTITTTDASIVQKVIGCAHGGTCAHQCTSAFRITPQEFEFYQRTNLPAPQLCHNCRHFERLAKRNPMQLHDRSCMCQGVLDNGGDYKNSVPHFHGDAACANTFATTYAPDRKETVYCEQCYQAEMA